jgi:hypothetical protein
MKPFPRLDATAPDLRYRLRERREIEYVGYSIPITSGIGRLYFLELLRDRGAHRREEPFDYRGAIEHLENLSDELPRHRRTLSRLAERVYRDIQRDIEELLKGLRKEQAHAENHRNRDRNSRPVRHKADMTTIIELIREQWDDVLLVSRVK